MSVTLEDLAFEVLKFLFLDHGIHFSLVMLAIGVATVSYASQHSDKMIMANLDTMIVNMEKTLNNLSVVSVRVTDLELQVEMLNRRLKTNREESMARAIKDATDNPEKYLVKPPADFSTQGTFNDLKMTHPETIRDANYESINEG